MLTVSVLAFAALRSLLALTMELVLVILSALLSVVSVLVPAWNWRRQSCMEWIYSKTSATAGCFGIRVHVIQPERITVMTTSIYLHKFPLGHTLAACS